ncbi:MULTISPECIES: hypothetical protein [Acinetobacter]|uniref:hypothetical protein n=1 Tax=Acinetobacter TaxID=469 RepID=UPI0015D44CEE|nr:MULTISPECIES: hypothetical protein [Acinetobacter]MDM1302651.1 hypothetical protein [Acinetobacter indicus]
MYKKIVFIFLTILCFLISLFIYNEFIPKFITISDGWNAYGKYFIVLLIPLLGYIENIFIWRHVNFIHNGQVIAPISLGFLSSLAIYVSL